MLIGWLLVVAAGDAFAQARVHRCRDAEGHWVFQGQPCGATMDAVPRSLPESAPSPVTGEPSGRPVSCESPAQRFVFADPALDGAEFDLVLSRDDNGYQVLLNLRGSIEREDGPAAAQFSARLGAQGLRFDQGELIAPDFRRGDKQLGFGHARSSALLDRAAKALELSVEIEPEGYAQSLWSAPMAASVLSGLRAEVLRCHLRRKQIETTASAGSESAR